MPILARILDSCNKTLLLPFDCAIAIIPPSAEKEIFPVPALFLRLRITWPVLISHKKMFFQSEVTRIFPAGDNEKTMCVSGPFTFGNRRFISPLATFQKITDLSLLELTMVLLSEEN
jgi:hypothetical protein